MHTIQLSGRFCDLKPSYHGPGMLPFGQLIEQPQEVDAGKEVARWAQQFLSAEDLLSDGSGGTISFYVSDSPELFAETAELFLGERVSGKVHQISLELLTDR